MKPLITRLGMLFAAVMLLSMANAPTAAAKASQYPWVRPDGTTDYAVLIGSTPALVALGGSVFIGAVVVGIYHKLKGAD